MRYLYLIVILVMLNGCSLKQITYTAALTTLAADWAQTKDLREMGHYEKNPIMGKQPSQEIVDLYFGSIFLAVVASHYVLNDKWAPWVYGAITLIETRSVWRNASRGIGLNFKVFQY